MSSADGSSQSINNPILSQTASDLARKVAETQYIDDGEALIKHLGGSVVYQESGEVFTQEKITVRVFGEEHSFESKYDMVQWIIKDVVPKVAPGAAQALSKSDADSDRGTGITKQSRGLFVGGIMIAWGILGALWIYFRDSDSLDLDAPQNAIVHAAIWVTIGCGIVAWYASAPRSARARRSSRDFPGRKDRHPRN